MEKRQTDILILGAGCAGLTAGIYAARAGKRVLILEKNIPGGQAALSSRIENYPGFAQIDGASLMQKIRAQAEHFGTEIVCCDVLSVDPVGKCVQTNQGCFSAGALILAMGAEPKPLGIPGEAEFRGSGVSYCASCDGFFYRGKEIYVVGGGNSAGEEALHLAQIGSRVHLLVRKDHLRCETAIREALENNPRIEIHYSCALAEIRGEGRVETLILRNTNSGEQRQVDGRGRGVFIFVGYRPSSDCVRGQLMTDEDGYLITDDELRAEIPGVFAAGDVRRKSLRQIVTAVSDGAEAAFHACKYLTDML